MQASPFQVAAPAQGGCANQPRSHAAGWLPVGLAVQALGSKAGSGRLTINFKPRRTFRSAAVSFCAPPTPGRTKSVSHWDSFGNRSREHGIEYLAAEALPARAAEQGLHVSHAAAKADLRRHSSNRPDCHTDVCHNLCRMPDVSCKQQHLSQRVINPRELMQKSMTSERSVEKAPTHCCSHGLAASRAGPHSPAIHHGVACIT